MKTDPTIFKAVSQPRWSDECSIADAAQRIKDGKALCVRAECSAEELKPIIEAIKSSKTLCKFVWLAKDTPTSTYDQTEAAIHQAVNESRNPNLIFLATSEGEGKKLHIAADQIPLIKNNENVGRDMEFLTHRDADKIGAHIDRLPALYAKHFSDVLLPSTLPEYGGAALTVCNFVRAARRNGIEVALPPAVHDSLHYYYQSHIDAKAQDLSAKLLMAAELGIEELSRSAQPTQSRHRG